MKEAVAGGAAVIVVAIVTVVGGAAGHVRVAVRQRVPEAGWGAWAAAWGAAGNRNPGPLRQATPRRAEVACPAGRAGDDAQAMARVVARGARRVASPEGSGASSSPWCWR
jgi:hypothetical protein